MTESEKALAEERRQADALGLTELAKRYPGELARALANARLLEARLPRDIHWSEEPAHIFPLSPRSATSAKGS